MGIIEELLGALFGEVIQGLSTFQIVIDVVLVGGFVWFMLSKFWWKPRQAESKKKDETPASDK